MSNTQYHNIEYYKSELTKKDEIIEKLFEEIDNLKDDQEELKKIIYNLNIENENLKNANLKLKNKKPTTEYYPTEDTEDKKPLFKLKDLSKFSKPKPEEK